MTKDWTLIHLSTKYFLSKAEFRQDLKRASSVAAPFRQNRRRNLRAMGRDPKARKKNKKPTMLTTVIEKCDLKIFFKIFLKMTYISFLS